MGSAGASPAPAVAPDAEPGELFAGRFTVARDEERLHDVRTAFRKGRDRRFAPERWQRRDVDEHLVRGVDRQTGAAVVIEPRGGAVQWARDLHDEAAARHVAALASPFTAAVLHVGGGIVYAEPPPALMPRPFAPADAARLALQACSVVAGLHAAGLRAPPFDPTNLRVLADGEGLRICWLAPGVIDFAHGKRPGQPPPLPDRIAAFVRASGPVQEDTWRLLTFFVTLVSAGTLAADPAVAELGRTVSHPEGRLPTDVASVARLLAPIAGVAGDVADLPAVRSLPPFPLDWDRVIVEGERRASAHVYGAEHYAIALAVAYHARARDRRAAGALAAALGDVERAVALHGDFLMYHTTRAVLLDTLGRRGEARRVLDDALAKVEAAGRYSRWDSSDAERARACATRGMIALREGAPAEAEPDLRRAMTLCVDPLYAHGLGAALYALGDVAGAAEAEACALELAPSNTRYRWAFIGSLRKLGRDHEALEQARAILALEPSSPAHLARFARLFGGAEPGAR